MFNFLPDFLSCLNLLSGCVGIYFLSQRQFEYAAWCTGCALIFDYADGFMARLLHRKSLLGKELDSLADMISFGFFPGYTVFQFYHINGTETHIYYFIAFLLTVFSALRLAKFNIDTRQSEHFIGLPTPANTIFIISLPLIYFYDKGPLKEIVSNHWFLSSVCFIFSFLLVSELPMFSLKFKNYKWQKNSVRYLFISISLILLILFGISGIALIIIFYILLSFNLFLLQNKKLSKHEVQS